MPSRNRVAGSRSEEARESGGVSDEVVVRSSPLTEPTEKQRQQAQSFGEWQRNIRIGKGMTFEQFALAIRFSDSQVRLFDADSAAGFDSTGRYRQPKERYIMNIAARFKVSAKAGMAAAGLVEFEEKRVITPGLTYDLIGGDGVPVAYLLEEEDLDYLLYRAQQRKSRE